MSYLDLVEEIVNSFDHDRRAWIERVKPRTLSRTAPGASSLLPRAVREEIIHDTLDHAQPFWVFLREDLKLVTKAPSTWTLEHPSSCPIPAS